MKKVIFCLAVALLAVSFQSQARLVLSSRAIYNGGNGCSPSSGWCLIIGKATAQANPGTMIGDLAYNGAQLTITMDKTRDITPPDYIQYFNQGQQGILQPGGVLSFDPNALLQVGWNGPSEFEGPFMYTEEGNTITVYIP